MKQNNSWDVLSKTFQDAILIARRLGVSCLWVDSLCIIQDDAEDWETEAADIADVYEHSDGVIMATSGMDGDAGCFSTRSETKELVIEDERGITPTIYHREALDRNHLSFDWTNKDHPTGFDGKLFDGGPLTTRGWCFQKRLLGRRMLHYTASEIVWECLGVINCECGQLDYWVIYPSLLARGAVADCPKDMDHLCIPDAQLQRLYQLYPRGGHHSEYVKSIPYISGNSALMFALTGVCDPNEFVLDVFALWRDIVKQ